MEVGESCKVFQYLFCLKFLVEIGSFICVCILCELSSHNPLESHRIGNLSNYFYVAENTTDPIKFINNYNNYNNNINFLDCVNVKVEYFNRF